MTGFEARISGFGSNRSTNYATTTGHLTTNFFSLQSDDPDWRGYFYTVLIVCVTFVCTLLNSQAFFREYLVSHFIPSAEAFFFVIYGKRAVHYGFFSIDEQIYGTDLAKLRQSG